MNNKIIIIILSSIIVVLVGIGIFRERTFRIDYLTCPINDPGRQQDRIMGMDDRGMGPGRHLCTPEFMRETLELNDDQIGRINALNETFEKEYDRLFEKIAPERNRLRTLIRQDNPDMKEVKSTLEKISSFNVEIQFLRIKQGKIISTILTPEQMKKLKHERRRFGRERGRVPGHGPDGMNER